MMTSSHPDASAIFSSIRRRASAVFNNALMLKVLPCAQACAARPGSACSLVIIERGCRRGPTAAPACLLADVGGLHRLRRAPHRELLAVVEIVVGDLLEQRILGRLLGQHFQPGLLERRQVLVAPALDLDAVLLLVLRHGGELGVIALDVGVHGRFAGAISMIALFWSRACPRPPCSSGTR